MTSNLQFGENLSSIEALKQHNDILSVASRYCELKKISSNQYKAKINPLRDEKTSSLFFYTDTNRFHDFGSGAGGDVLDFIQLSDKCTFPEAKEILSSSLSTYIEPVRVKVSPKVKISQVQLEKEFSAFEPMTFKNAEHTLELLTICPKWLYDTSSQEDLELFKSLTRYDRKNKTLVMSWCKNNDMSNDMSFDMVSYKRRRYLHGKWVNRKDTSPNQVAFHRIYEDNVRVYIIEGAHDALTAVLLGLNFIAIPSTGYKNIDELKSILSADNEVIYVVEDQIGYECMKKLQSEVSGRMISLNNSKDEKMDLSDFIINNNSKKEVQDVF